MKKKKQLDENKSLSRIPLSDFIETVWNTKLNTAQKDLIDGLDENNKLVFTPPRRSIYPCQKVK